MIWSSDIEALVARFGVTARILARSALAGLAVFAVLFFAGQSLLTVQRAEVRLLVLPSATDGVDAAADAAVRLAASPTFLRAAVQAMPAGDAARLEAGLAPRDMADRLPTVFSFSGTATPEERRVAALSKALQVRRLAAGPIIAITVDADDARLAAAAAEAVAGAYITADATGADRGARIMGGVAADVAAAPGFDLLAIAGGLLAALLVGLGSFHRRRRHIAADDEPHAPPVAGSLPIDLRLAAEDGEAAVDAVWHAVGGGEDGPRCLVVCGAGETDRARLAAALLAGETLDGDGPTVIVDLVATPSPDGSPAHLGFGDVLDGAASFGEVIQRGAGQRVHVITASDEPLVLEPAVRRERFAAVIEALVLTYDHVVVHADPFERAIIDALRGHADGFVLAVDRAGCGPEADAAYEALAARAGLPVVVVAVEGALASAAPAPAQRHASRLAEAA